jgi:hypothetical protein
MARVLRSVRGHVYAYQVESYRDAGGRSAKRQAYIGPATPAEVAAWQERRSARQEACHNAQGRPQPEAVGIYDPSDTMPPSGDASGRGYWRDGQKAAAFLGEIMVIYRQRTGHTPSLAICHPGQVADLQGHGLEVRSARVNARLVILRGEA